MALSKYQRPQSLRDGGTTHLGRFRGGKLAPIHMEAFRESESGVLEQAVTFELDPIAGRMITPITAEIVSVYVPAQAMHALENPTDDYPGNTEVVRQLLLSGSPLFGLENEGELSKRMNIVPRSIAGVQKVSKVARLGHNVAVNFLRQRKYVNAIQLLAASTDLTPALISQTVLDKFNAVLDPEDRVNGAVNLTGQIPITGVGTNSASFPSSYSMRYAGGTAPVTGENLTGGVFLAEDPDNTGYPKIFADLAASTTGISLTDFYIAEKMDRLTREMREVVDQNPQYGEEMLSRFAHGLSVDVGKQPFVIYEKRIVLGMNMQRAMDGGNLDVTQSNLTGQIGFTVPVPATELGGVVVTFASIKPDETLASQPHPILSDNWGARNYVSEELAINPVPVTIRELDADCDVGDEGTIAFYSGYNHLHRSYHNYGLNRHLDPLTVAAKTAIWQLELPLSVTPSSVLYPETLGHYPFADQTAEVCQYTIMSRLNVNTPMQFGPTPVEELAVIETADLFEDA